jgi:hypothetical protein
MFALELLLFGVVLFCFPKPSLQRLRENGIAGQPAPRPDLAQRKRHNPLIGVLKFN